MAQRSYEKWTPEEEQDLVRRFKAGAAPSDIAAVFGRSEPAIRSRLAKLDLLCLVMPPDGGIEGEVNSSVDIQQAFRRFRFVYGIVNPTGQVYIGYSGDVWHRIAQHNRDHGAVVTAGRGPWFPFAIYCFAAEADARAMETFLRRNFAEFVRISEASLKEVLAQIGVPNCISRLRLL